VEAAKYELEQLQPLVENERADQLVYLKDALETSKKKMEEAPKEAVDILDYIIRKCKTISDTEDMVEEAEALIGEAKEKLVQL